MKEIPILFSAPMVRALLAGTKTQTRRVVKPQPEDHHWYRLPGYRHALEVVETSDGSFLRSEHWRGPVGGESGPRADGREWFRNPYGNPGDLLWVKETHCVAGPNTWGGLPKTVQPGTQETAYYREGFDRCAPSRWRPSIFMPKWACRIWLEVTGVRVERLNDISEEDAKAEGIRSWSKDGELYKFGVDEPGDPGAPPWSEMSRTAKAEFFRLWESINGLESLAANPWVWVIDFKRAKRKAVAA